MIEALMAHMALYPDSTLPGRPLFVIHDRAGRPLVLVVDAAGRLLLLRDGAWSAIGLPAPVHRADIRQAGDGTLCIALALANGILLVATGIAPALAEGWQGALVACPGLPPQARPTRLAFGPLQQGAPPLLLVSADVGGEPATWYGNAATPALGLRLLRLPDHACAVGSYRLPGVWVLRDGALRFTSFGTAGREIEVIYPNLPARTDSVLLAPGSMPNVPDVFAAGAAIVVYRGNNGVPQRVADVAGARLLWSARNRAGEYLVYAYADATLWLVARPAHGAWRPPVFVTSRRAVPLALHDGTLHAAALHEGALTLLRYDAQGTPLSEETIGLP
jgi:hypothetical protein